MFSRSVFDVTLLLLTSFFLILLPFFFLDYKCLHENINVPKPTLRC